MATTTFDYNTRYIYTTDMNSMSTTQSYTTATYQYDNTGTSYITTNEWYYDSTKSWSPCYNTKTWRTVDDPIYRWWYSEKQNHQERMQSEIDRVWNRFLEEERQTAAESKAEDLMSMLIGEKEFIKYKETGRAYVRGKNGLYLVKKGGGISQIKDNKIIDFCVHIDHKHNCPPTDHAIALKLMLEDDDRKVIKLANRIGTKSLQQLPIAACM